MKLLSILFSLFMGLALSQLVWAYSEIQIPQFPSFGDCQDYPLLGESSPQYMECSTSEGDRFSVPIGWDSKRISEETLRAATVIEMPPIRQVYYIGEKGLYVSAVIYSVEQGVEYGAEVKPMLITGDYRLQEHYIYFCDNAIRSTETSITCTTKESVPSDFAYYAFLNYTGGGHCCFYVTIFDKEPPHHVLYVYDAGSFPPIFKDVDGNGQYEMVAGDWTYESWPYGYVSTPAPKIIWRMTPSGFSLATDLMLKPLPDASTLANYKADIEKEFDGNYIPYDLYATTLDFIYSGNEAAAWEFFNDAWPSNTESKEKFRAEMVEEICDSLFAGLLNNKDGNRERFLGITGC